MGDPSFSGFGFLFNQFCCWTFGSINFFVLFCFTTLKHAGINILLAKSLDLYQSRYYVPHKDANIGKGLAQGHIAGEWHSRDSSPCKYWVVLLLHSSVLTLMSRRTQERICKILGPISVRSPKHFPETCEFFEKGS